MHAEGATIWVANNGVDTNTCGASTAPCRSIRQGILRAAALDTVMVSPGRYGDLNGNNVLGETGEEDGNGVCSCFVNIDKQVTVRSQKGAQATLIEVPSWFTGVKVRLSAAGAAFGAANGGFFVKASQGTGIQIAATNVTVSSNVLQGGASGIQIASTNATVDGNQVRYMTQDGINLRSGATGAITNNVSSGNGQSGFTVNGGASTFANNKAIGNTEHGFAIYGASSSFNGNFTIANQLTGFFVASTGTGNQILNNTVNGNLSGGVRAFVAPASATGNNFYGNGPNPNSCQFENGTATTMNAPNNFWGGGLPAGSTCGNGPVNANPVSNTEYIAAYPNVAGQVIVGANGSDAAGCGTVNVPCRTLLFAITQVPVNGTILLKPGRYGFTMVGPPPGPMMDVNKAGVTVKAHGGFGTAVIFGNGTALLGTSADSVTVQGLVFQGTNLNVGLVQSGPNGRAYDNVFLKSRMSPGYMGLAYRNVFGEGGIEGIGQFVAGLQNNQVFGGNRGINFFVNMIGPPPPFAPANFQGNAVIGTTTDGYGFNAGQLSGAVLTSGANYSVGNESGILFGPLAVDTHRLFGFHVIGNRVYGVRVLQNATSMTSFNIFGNGEVPNANYPAGCGVITQGNPAAAQDLKNNFWGVSTGPGALNPADAYCSQGSIPALVNPFLTTAIVY